MSAAFEHTAPPSVIGIVTALEKELRAVYVAFGIQYDPSRAIVRGNRRYDTFDLTCHDGSVHQIIVTEPSGMGNNRAAVTTTSLLNDFPDVLDVVLVGIAGAVPHPSKAESHVRLGDVIVLGDKGVIQYDNVKITNGVTEYRHDPRPPSQRLLDAAMAIQRAAATGIHMIDAYLAKCDDRYRRPDPSLDVLRDDKDAEPAVHPHDPDRRDSFPRYFIGAIGSSNTLLKDVAIRNRLRDEHKVMAIEMESSGAAEACQKAGRRFFAVRGTCDYCNQDKEDHWHLYAAYIAAATLHCILKQVSGSPRRISTEDPPDDIASASLGTAADQAPPEPQHQARAVSVPTSAAGQAQEVPLEPLTTSVASQVATIAIPNAESKPLAVDTAEDYVRRLGRASAELDFERAQALGVECEDWMKSNGNSLTAETRVKVYTALAQQALQFERVTANSEGRATATHTRSKVFLALAQEALQ